MQTIRTEIVTFNRSIYGVRETEGEKRVRAAEVRRRVNFHTLLTLWQPQSCSVSSTRSVMALWTVFFFQILDIDLEKMRHNHYSRMRVHQARSVPDEPWNRKSCVNRIEWKSMQWIVIYVLSISTDFIYYDFTTEYVDNGPKFTGMFDQHRDGWLSVKSKLCVCFCATTNSRKYTYKAHTQRSWMMLTACRSHHSRIQSFRALFIGMWCTLCGYTVQNRDVPIKNFAGQNQLFFLSISNSRIPKIKCA